MASERKLDRVQVTPFTLVGGNDGTVTVSSTSGFKVKASVVISAVTFQDLTLEVKAVISETQLIVGLPGNINNRYDLSGYTTFLNSAIFQPSQDRPKVPRDDQDRATYESEPTLARRVIMVDELGNLHSDKNPITVTSKESLLSGLSYDDLRATYPDSVTENYSYYLKDVLVATVQVTYTDSTKDILTRARRI